MVALRMTFLFEGQELATGTGFMYESGAENFLVTNWHNVTGRDPANYKLKHSRAAIPDSCIIRVPAGSSEKGIPLFPEMTFMLYNDKDCLIPRWVEHPTHRGKVDIVAFRWPTKELLLQLNPEIGHLVSEAIPANSFIHSLKNFRIDAGMDAIVLGFPRGLDAANLAIWKRASIASEYAFDIDGLPKFYIDTATREGMSGSPVYARTTTFEVNDGLMNVQKRSRFLGIYSGRIVGEDHLAAQIGIVWKERAIWETIHGKTPGVSSFELVEKPRIDDHVGVWTESVKAPG